jgi:hypothetical protein
MEVVAAPIALFVTLGKNASVQQSLSMDPIALPFVIPSEAEGSAVPRTLRGNAQFYPQTELSSRPERTRISCHAAQDATSFAAFIKESSMNFASATNLNRKSGVA